MIAWWEAQASTSKPSCACDDDVATPLDASYHKGQGARQGEERAVEVQESASFDGADVSATINASCSPTSNHALFSQNMAYLARVNVAKEVNHE